MWQVWTAALQLRNEIKKRAKMIIEHTYGLSNLNPKQRISLAQWLLQTCPIEETKGGGGRYKLSIPYFVFDNPQITWNKETNEVQVSSEQIKVFDTGMLTGDARRTNVERRHWLFTSL